MYYGDGLSYYYGGGLFSNHSSLMTGTGRTYAPLRYAPHLSTISESPLSTYRRYSPAVISSRPRRIIDTADIDVSTPRTFQSNHTHGNRLRRDRPTIRIRSQALKDNPALRDHIERREKTVGELLVEKFLIKDKKLSPDDIKMKLYHQVSMEAAKEQQDAIQKRITRKMQRRRSSADVQIDPEQLQREIALAQAQAEVLDNLVAEEQAEIEVETRKETLQKHRGSSAMLRKSDSESDVSENVDAKRKIPKKLKKRKKTTDKPSPPQENLKAVKDDEIQGNNLKNQDSPGVPNISMTNSNVRDVDQTEQFSENIQLPAPRLFVKSEEPAEHVIVVPAKKYIRDESRNSAYLTLKAPVGKVQRNDKLGKSETFQSIADDGPSRAAKNRSKDIIQSDREVKVTSAMHKEGLEELRGSAGRNKTKQKQSDLSQVAEQHSIPVSTDNSSQSLNGDCLESFLKNTLDDKSQDLICRESTESRQPLSESDLAKNLKNVVYQEGLPNATLINLGESVELSVDSKETKTYLEESSVSLGGKVSQEEASVIEKTNKLAHCGDKEYLSASLEGEDVKVQDADEILSEVEKKNVKKPWNARNLLKSPIEKSENDIGTIDKTEFTNSEVSKGLPSKNIERPLKNKNLTKLMHSSTDSGIGSLEPAEETVEKPEKKKILKNSKGLSFEGEEEPKLKSLVQNQKGKLVNDKKSLDQNDDNKSKTKTLDIKNEIKLTRTNANITSKSIPKTPEVKTKKTGLKIVSTEKEIAPLLPIVQEQIKYDLLPKKILEDSSEDSSVDFWNEIKPKNSLNPIKQIESSKNSLSEIATVEPLILPQIEEVKLDTLSLKSSLDSVERAIKTNKCTENLRKSEKKEKIGEIIFNAASPETPKHKTDEKSSENSETKKKSLQKQEPVSEEFLEEESPKMATNCENIILPAGSPIINESKIERQEPPTPVTDKPVPVINIVEMPLVSSANEDVKEEDYDDDDDEDDDDDGPKTPTNEETRSLNNISKWCGSSNLTNLNEKEVATFDSGNEAASSQLSSKKKLGRRKKSVVRSVESTIKRIPEERSTSNSSETTLKPTFNLPSPKISPKTSPKTNRPVDLIKMFYTTPASLLTATPRDLSKVKRAKIKRRKHSSRTPSASSDSTGSSRSDQSTATSTRSNSTEVEDETEQKRVSSTRSNDSGFDGSPRLSNCDMACHKKCEKLTGNLCGLNQKLVSEALQALKKAPSQSSADNQRNSGNSEHIHSSGRITPPATNLPRFKKYVVDDFNFLKVLGKGSFGKVLLAELRGTDCVYAVKCLKKDVVLEDDDVECSLIERKVLTLATRHPYLCHLFCTFQTNSHLFFVMEYLNGGDLMFHIQKSGRFPEFRAKFYAAEIWSGLNFLHKKGIVYRDLKLDNVLLDFEGHIRIADFGMCKLQIFLDRTADTFCGTPDYMAPEIIKGLKYNQSVDWWSFGVLLYEMLTGQSPFSGCDEDELFWSICNERPFIPRYLSQESMDILVCLLEKDAGKRPLGHEIQVHTFFHHIHWDRLERRLLDPPFKPALEHTLDTKYFDTAFTAERPRLTPVPEQILSSMDQGVFRGFSYTNPNATD